MTVYLPYRLRLRRPALLGAPTGDPNSAVTLDFIPGSSMRGAVAAVVAGEPDVLERLVLNVGVRYLNAYWEVDGVRSLPTPAHLRIEAQRCSLAAFADDLAAAELTKLAGENPRIPPGLTRLPPYCAPAGDDIQVGSPRRIGRIHNSRDPERGRSWTDPSGTTHGAVFSYEAIDAGQAFRGLIAVDDPNLAHDLQSVLPADSSGACEASSAPTQATIRVGRSKLAGYGGLASLEWLPMVDDEVSASSWQNGQISEGTNLLFELLSDAIVRDPATGTVDPGAIEAVVATRGFRTVASWRTVTSTGGFNAKWGLPLPSYPAVAAGSSFLVTTNRPIKEAEVVELLSSGIGLRRRDGFGRLRLADSPASDSVRVTAIEQPAPLSPEGSAPPLVREMAHRRLRNLLNEHLSRQAVFGVDRATAIPSNSLLGRIRTQLRSGQGISAVHKMLKPTNLKAPARAQLNRCEFTLGTSEPPTLLNGLTALTADDHKAFMELAGIEPIAINASIGGYVPRLTDDDIESANRHLIDEILTALHNRQRTSARDLIDGRSSTKTEARAQ